MIQDIYLQDTSNQEGIIRIMSSIIRYMDKYSKRTDKALIFAAMGLPTLPIPIELIQNQKSFWEALEKKTIASNALIEEAFEANSIENRNTLLQQAIDIKPYLPYGEINGELNLRQEAAALLSKLYSGANTITIAPEEVILTTGAAAGIYASLKVIQEMQPGKVIATTAPTYGLYQGMQDNIPLLTSDVMMHDVNGNISTTISSKNFQEIICKANELGKSISAFILVDPNNPGGTVISAREMMEIASVFRSYIANNPDTMILLDESYAELTLDMRKHNSLLSIAPDLKDNIIIYRSTTKCASTPAIRTACVIAPNKKIILKSKISKNGKKIIKYTTMAQELANQLSWMYGMAPISIQMAYVDGLKSVSTSKTQKRIQDFYGLQVTQLLNGLRKKAIKTNQPEGTFYVLVDLNELLGTRIEDILLQDFQNLSGNHDNSYIKSDIDIMYYLTIKHGIVIAPTSTYYQGVSKKTQEKKGIMRVTCSVGPKNLNVVIDAIVHEVMRAREKKVLLATI